MSDGPPPDFSNDSELQNDNDDSVFVSVSAPANIDLSLGDDDNPFGEQTEPENTTNTVDSTNDFETITTQEIKREDAVAAKTEDVNLIEPESVTTFSSAFDDSPFGIDTTTKAAPVPVKVESPAPIPVKVESPAPMPAKVESPVSNWGAPNPLETYNSQSMPATANVFSEIKTETLPKKRATEYNIEITVGDPTKVGEGMSSYMVYRITTKTTLSIFKKSEFAVSRRFSDFLGLHVKLINKHLSAGVILPSPPEKDSVSMAKVKISTGEDLPTDFIDRRRALLERYLNRIVRHPKLIEDPDVREFIEAPNDLPKATNTQALSGAGFIRGISIITNQVTKLTTKSNEQDQWFEEKFKSTVDLITTLKRLYTGFNSIFSQRREAAHNLKQFSVSLNHLATAEEHPLLSNALVELANLEEKLDQIENEHNRQEYSTLTELMKEYISLLEMVILSFQERVKVHQHWLNAEDTLRKKRENKAKFESSPKTLDKVPQAEMEIRDWEGRANRAREDFEQMSTAIKQESEVFDEIRIEEFQRAFSDYLEDLVDEETRILQVWEDYLSEAAKIVV